MYKSYALSELELPAKNSDLHPERKLLTALLRRAILDFGGRNIALADSARQWIFADEGVGDGSHFSCAWVCEQLDIELKSFLEEMEEYGEMHG